MSQLFAKISDAVTNCTLVLDYSFTYCLVDCYVGEQVLEFLNTSSGYLDGTSLFLYGGTTTVRFTLNTAQSFTCTVSFYNSSDELTRRESVEPEFGYTLGLQSESPDSDCSATPRTLSTVKTLTEVPPEPTLVDVESAGTTTESTEPITWPTTVTGGDAGTDVVCLPSQQISHQSCGSNDNPSIDTLPDGWSIIAYESRDRDGNSKISLALFATSLDRTVFYYRKNSLGRLINDYDLGAYGAGTFEIYDDIVVTANENNEPDPEKYIVFLNGPLQAGSFFKINQITREAGTTTKHVVKFDLGSREAQFPDANDATDVRFAIFESTLPYPCSQNLEIWNLPVHKYNGLQVPVANPSIAVPKNNLMVGGEQFVYLVYQAYENNQWNLYFKQIRFSELGATDPIYVWPFTFSDPPPCTQYVLYDDPYCPSPYVPVTYEPVNFYTLQVGTETVSRVIYHLSVSDQVVVEKDENTFATTFLNRAELLITYAGDLSTEWETPTLFQFTDLIPDLSSDTKGITNAPFTFELDKVYNVDPVHLMGDSTRWVYFLGPGEPTYYYPNVGVVASEQSTPFLLVQNATNPKITVNSVNQVFVVYESYSTGTPQIKIIGTGDFSQKSYDTLKRQTRFLELNDFCFSYTVTDDDNLNQLPNIAIDSDNVVHLCWQSSRDAYWEIYYGNGSDLFSPVRITDFDSRSSCPVIEVDSSNNVFIAFHDNRFEHFEVFLAAYTSDRWHSSGFGYSDTRLTDSLGDSLRPSIKVKPDDTLVVFFENHDLPQVAVKAVKYTSSTQWTGSGTLSYFDYSFTLSGQDVDSALDLFERLLFVAEQPDNVPLSTTALPTNTLYYKACDFASEEDGQQTDEICPIISLEGTTVVDNYTSSDVIKKITIRKEDVKYFTRNVSGRTIPVVSNCNVRLEIYGEPEVVAYRIRNEIDTVYSDWCSWNPKLSSYLTETAWKLSGGSGLKEVCVQVLTYSGVTSEFCIPVIADYEIVIYDIKLYRKENELLSLYDGFFVANTSIGSNGDANPSEEITVEIYPNKYFGETKQPFVFYDVIQQGLNDILGATATRSVTESGREIYAGKFTIYREDKKLNKDGLAQIKVYFPDSCENQGMTATSTRYEKDSFNSFSLPAEDTTIVSADDLASYRQSDTGKIGVPILIRPASEDPYFMFGDPDYYLQQQESEQTGIIKEE